MKGVTPATKNSNTPQKVLMSLEPMTTTSICITDIMTGEQLIKRLQAIMRFIKALDIGMEYDVLIQIDKQSEERCESDACTADNERPDNKD